MTQEQEFKKLFCKMAKLCEENKWGDPFLQARAKEIFASIELGHKVASKKSGADAFLEDGTPVEYKSTIDTKCKGAYTGISKKRTWEEQMEYLQKDKIGKYPFHFFNRFSDGDLVESWRMDGDKVLELLLPKLKRSFDSCLDAEDPRVAANITPSEIKKYGKRVI